MKKVLLITALTLGVLLIAVLVHLLQPYTFAVFEPAGLIATSEKSLIVHATLLMLIVVVPVCMLLFSIAWRYRASNTNAVYTPNKDHSYLEEFVWWAIPFEIILVLAALTYSSTYQLDPHKQLANQGDPFVVQVVALDWKWLFIYPSLGIATVNELHIPANTPIEFQITADAPMNSFWIPQLGGQIYAMTGMVTLLHLLADKPGVYNGASANYSGDGFSDMKFIATASNKNDFDTWAFGVKQSSQSLTDDSYLQLAEPGTTTEQSYATVQKNLYNTIVMKFASPNDMQEHTHAH